MLAGEGSLLCTYPSMALPVFHRHLSSVTFNMRGVSFENPVCVSAHYGCAGLVALLTEMNSICWVRR